ncbi:MAG: extracellular solute-binding protein [Deltaproteobacteria bacterium]|nr:extracellular solute-binding protein [Deltaproteobacteria bacterium]
MIHFTNNLLNFAIRLQILILPIVIFYLICYMKKISPDYKWIVHRFATLLFLLLPLSLLVLSISYKSVPSKLIVSPHLDLRRKWIPESEIEATLKSLIPKRETIQTEILPAKKNGEEVAKTEPERIPSIKTRRIKKSFDFSKLLHLFPIISFILLLKMVCKLIIQSIRERHIIKGSVKDIYNNYPVYYSEKINTPFTTGVFSKKVFIPVGYLNKGKTAPILKHEMAHIHGDHNFWTLLETLVVFLNWYNPFFYFYRKHGDLLKELLADKTVTISTDPIEYSRLIVKELEAFEQHRSYYLATGFIKKKIIKERITNLMNPNKQKPTGIIKMCGYVSVIISIALTAMFGCSQTKEISDPEDFSYVNISKVTNLNEYYDIKDNKVGAHIRKTQGNEIIIPLWEKDEVKYTYFDQDGNIQKQISVERVEIEKIAYTIDSSGMLVVFIYNQLKQTGVLRRYSDDGSFENIMTLQDLNWEGINHIEIDNSETLYVYNYETLNVFKNGKKIEIDETRGLRSMTINPEGILYYVTWDNQKEINIWNCNANEITRFETPYENSVLSYIEEKLLVMDTKGIKEYKGSDFLGYITNSEDYPEIIDIHNKEMVRIENNIYIASIDFNTNSNILTQIEITDEKREVDNRPVLTMQVSSRLHSSMEYSAKMYNKIQKKVRIEISQYENVDDWKAYKEKLNTEILAGEGTDIIFLSYLPYNDYVGKGVLEDLSLYMERDKSFNRDDYFPAVTALENKNGLYGLATIIMNGDITFYVKESLMRKYGYSGMYAEIPWNEFIEIALKEKGVDSNGMEIYPLGIEDRNGGDESIYDILYTILHTNNCFINEELNIFEENKFIDCLKVLDTIKTEKLIKPGLVEAEDFFNSAIEGSILLCNYDISKMPFYLSLKKNIFDSEPVMVVHPIFGNKGMNFRTTLLGINSQSEYKDEAWSFLKYLLSEESQENFSTFNHAFTVNKKVMRNRTESSLKDIDNMSISMGGFDMNGCADYTENEVEGYYDLMENYRYISSNKGDLMGIVFEQIQPFVEGERTLDETVAIVKERVDTYINE